MEGLEEENLQKKMEEIEKTIENTAKDKRKVHASVIRALVITINTGNSRANNVFLLPFHVRSPSKRNDSKSMAST